MQYRYRVVLALVLVGLGGGLAPAEDRYLSAERVAARGRLLVRVGKIDLGIAAYREAYRLAPDPAYVLREAEAQEQVGRIPEALAAYERLLQSADSKAAYPRIRAHVTSLRAELAETHGEVVIDVTPRASEVFLDAVAADHRLRLPFTTWLSAGEHAVLVDEPGFEATKVSFSVDAGAPLLRVTVPLLPEQAEGALIVRANRREAVVYIDGVERCKTPCEEQLAPGTYLVRVEHTGDRPIQQLVRIRSHATVPVDAMLRPGPSSFATTDFGTGDGSEPIERPEPPRSPGGGRTRVLGIVGWVTLGVGLGAAGAGGVFNYLTFAKADEADGLDPTRPDYDRRFSDLKSEVERDALLTTILYAAGGALVAGGLTMVLIDALTPEDGGGGEGEVIPVAPGPAPGGGVMLNARFRF